jgi:hypothetical protein
MKKILIFPLLLVLFTFLSSFAPMQQGGFNIHYTGKTISRAQLSVYSHVYAGYGADFPYDLKVNVLSYDIIIVPAHGNAFFESVKGNAIPADIQQHFKTLKAGDMILLTNVQVKGAGGIMNIDGPSLRVI